MVSHKKRIVTISMLILGLMLGVALYAFNRYLSRQYDKNTLEAKKVALVWATKQCQTEGYAATTCASLYVDTGDATECNGQTCWLVAIYSHENNEYGSIVTTGFRQDEEEISVLDYSKCINSKDKSECTLNK